MKNERFLFLTTVPIATAAILVLTVALFSQQSQERPMSIKEFIPFQQFITNTEKATLGEYTRRPGGKVANEKEFSKMKNHILSMYKGVIVKNSFVMENNAHIDCIDMKTQPGLRKGGVQVTIQSPPKPAVVQEYSEEPKSKPVEPMLAREKRDQFGNAMFCEDGFIPMRRITLDELTRFRTLEDFFNKFGKAGKSGVPGEK